PGPPVFAVTARRSAWASCDHVFVPRTRSADPLAEPPGGTQLALFGQPRPVARSRKSTDRALAQLRALHRLEPVNVAQVAMLRTSAVALDGEVRASPEAYSAWTLARLVQEWRALWGELCGRLDSGFDDQLAAFFGDTTDVPPAPVRD